MKLKILLLTFFLQACENVEPEQTIDPMETKRHQLDTKMEELYQTQEVIKYVDEEKRLLDEALGESTTDLDKAININMKKDHYNNNPVSKQ